MNWVEHRIERDRKTIAQGGKLAIAHDRVCRWLLPADVWADKCVIRNDGAVYYKDDIEVGRDLRAQRSPEPR